MQSKTLRDWLQTEPFTLSLSAGFFGFYAHAGFVSVLEDEGLVPRMVTGSSAGALVGGLWASGCQMGDLRSFLFKLNRRDFWDPHLGFGLLKGDRFDAILKSLLNCENIEETMIPLRIAVFDLKNIQTRYLDSGVLSSSIRASCAFPGLFQPVELDGAPHLDGGILDRSGMGGLSDGLPVLYHHLQSRSKIRRHLKRQSRWQHRSNLVSITLKNLPKVSPFRLHRGPQAFEAARTDLQRRLDEPIHPSPL